MKISLNKHDIHTAIREYLRTRNISSDTTEMEIAIKAVKGGQPSAEVNIIDSMSTPTVVKTSDAPDSTNDEKSKSLFGAVGSE